MEVLDSSLTVNFSDEDAALQGTLLIEKDDREQTSLRTQYLRVFPRGVGKLFAVTGSIVRAGREESEVTESLAFTDVDTMPLRYPEASSVNIDVQGSFYSKEGFPISTHVYFDAATNSIQSSRQGFGLVTVTYKAKYTLYKFLYDGWGCVYESDYKGPPTPPSAYTPYEDSLVIVYEASKGLFASVLLEGPECSFKTVGTRDSRAGSVVLEIDKDGPIAMALYKKWGQADTAALQASAIVRQYPDVDANLTANVGLLTPTIYSVSEVKEEMLSFSESNGATLKYPPVSGVEFLILSPEVLDEWGRHIGATGGIRFNVEGSVVRDVNWTGPDEYEGSPEDRIVQPGEVVVTDQTGKTIRITGVVKAAYSTTYRVYTYAFQDKGLKEDGTLDFYDGYLSALYRKVGKEDQAGDLELKAPSNVGVDEYSAPDIL